MSGSVVQIDSSRKFRGSIDLTYEAYKAREVALSRLLMAYIVAGLAFMLLPGTFLGVWNLISITNRHGAEAISPAWIQAHGHAQIFGWIGSFILGIGFHSIPTVRRNFALKIGWTCFALWTAGVTLRWATNVYLWHWRVALPVSACLELIAFLLFFRAVSQHEPKEGSGSQLEGWIWVVIVATLGFFATLIANAGEAFYLAIRGANPAFTQTFDQRYLVLAAWGFLVPFVWGFSNKWLPIFLGLKSPDMRLLTVGLGLNTLGVVAGLAGFMSTAAVLVFHGAVFAIFGLHLFERAKSPAKIKGVHSSFPIFIRTAYVWLLIAGTLGIWASRVQNASGIWGASRHALTVGFIGIMVFSIGQRVLPAFSGMKLLFSPRLMFAGLMFLSVGCVLRVSSEVLAYQEYVHGAWKVLPVSAVLELTGVSIFAFNLIASFASRPAHLLKQSSPAETVQLAQKES